MGNIISKVFGGDSNKNTNDNDPIKEQEQKQHEEEKRARELREQEEQAKEEQRKHQEALEKADKQQKLFRNTALMLVAIFYNYPFGIKNEGEWTNNVNNLFNQSLTEEVYWILVKIPQLMPLLWPTGEADNDLHVYDTSNNNISINDWMNILKQYIPSYIKENLRTYLTNIFKANCISLQSNKINAQDERFNKCITFVESVTMLADENELLKKLQSLVDEQEYYTWKLLYSKSKKGICMNEVKLLPKNYPKLCPIYEIYEALIMVSNTLINTYGQAKNKDGTDIKVVKKDTIKNKLVKKYSELTTLEIQKFANGEHNADDMIEIEEEVDTFDNVKPGTNGGMCFDLNESWINNAKRLTIDNGYVWNCVDMKYIADNALNEKDVVGSDDYTRWMVNPSINTNTEVWFMNDDVLKSNGKVRYVNPTRKYTSTFIKDNDNVLSTLPFVIPSLSAKLNNEFSKNFILKVYEGMLNPNNKKYCSFDNVNKNIMCSFEYISLVPPGMKKDLVNTKVSPMAQFLYMVLILQTSDWSLTLPINTTMSCGSINNKLIELNGSDKDLRFLPQYIWCRNESLINEMTRNNNGKLNESGLSVNVKNSIDMVKNNIRDVQTGNVVDA